MTFGLDPNTLDVNVLGTTIQAAPEYTSGVVATQYVQNLVEFREVFLLGVDPEEDPDVVIQRIDNNDPKNYAESLTSATENLLELALNGLVVDGKQQYMTIEMAEGFDGLVKSLLTAGATINFDTGEVIITKNNVKNWVNLAHSSKAIEEILTTISFKILEIDGVEQLEVESNRTFQSLVELIYVKEGNRILTSNLSDLEEAISSTKDTLSSLNELQQLHNKIEVEDHIPFEDTQAGQDLLNASSPEEFEEAQNALREHFDVINPVVNKADFTSTDRATFLKINNDLTKQIAFLETLTPTPDGPVNDETAEGTLLSELKKVKADIEAALLAGGVSDTGAVVSADAVNSALRLWILDNLVQEGVENTTGNAFGSVTFDEATTAASRRWDNAYISTILGVVNDSQTFTLSGIQENGQNVVISDQNSFIFDFFVLPFNNWGEGFFSLLQDDSTVPFPLGVALYDDSEFNNVFSAISPSLSQDVKDEIQRIREDFVNLLEFNGIDPSTGPSNQAELLTVMNEAQNIAAEVHTLIIEDLINNDFGDYANYTINTAAFQSFITSYYATTTNGSIADAGLEPFTENYQRLIESNLEVVSGDPSQPVPKTWSFQDSNLLSRNSLAFNLQASDGNFEFILDGNGQIASDWENITPDGVRVLELVNALDAVVNSGGTSFSLDDIKESVGTYLKIKVQQVLSELDIDSLVNGNPLSTSNIEAITNAVKSSLTLNGQPATLDDHFNVIIGLLSEDTALESGESVNLEAIFDDAVESLLNASSASSAAASALAGREKGDIQQNITAAITAGQSLNDSQKEQVRKILFVFEEYYKSAAAILNRITQILERMAQAIAR